MGFFKSLKKVVGHIANPVQGIAAATTGGLSLLAPPKVQTQIGAGIISFAAGGAAGILGGSSGAAAERDIAMTSQQRQASQRQRGPQSPRGYSPSAYAQRLGRRRYASRRSNLVYPPSAGDPPSQTGFLYRGTTTPRPRRMRRFRA